MNKQFRRLVAGIDYFGDIDGDHRPHGVGEQSVDGHLIVRGVFVRGQMMGPGIKNDYKKRTLYKGEFLENRMHGVGELVGKDMRILGNFKYDLPSGVCSVSESAGNVLTEGTFLQGLSNGYCIMKTPNKGYIFEGMFSNGKREGAGIEIIEQKGAKYQGAFTNDNRHGVGFLRISTQKANYTNFCHWNKNIPDRFTVEDDRVTKTIYEGELNKGQKTGVCKIVARAYSYLGEIDNGRRNGFGRFENDSESFVGIWIEDKRTGVGLATNTRDGSVYFGEWKQNHREGFGILKIGDKISFQRYTEGKKYTVPESSPFFKTLDLTSFNKKVNSKCVSYQKFIDIEKAKLEQAFNALHFDYSAQRKYLSDALLDLKQKYRQLTIMIDSHKLLLKDDRSGSELQVIKQSRGERPPSPIPKRLVQDSPPDDDSLMGMDFLKFDLNLRKESFDYDNHRNVQSRYLDAFGGFSLAKVRYRGDGLEEVSAFRTELEEADLEIDDRGKYPVQQIEKSNPVFSADNRPIKAIRKEVEIVNEVGLTPPGVHISPIKPNKELGIDDLIGKDLSEYMTGKKSEKPRLRQPSIDSLTVQMITKPKKYTASVKDNNSLIKGEVPQEIEHRTKSSSSSNLKPSNLPPSSSPKTHLSTKTLHIITYCPFTRSPSERAVESLPTPERQTSPPPSHILDFASLNPMTIQGKGMKQSKADQIDRLLNIDASPSRASRGLTSVQPIVITPVKADGRPDVHDVVVEGRGADGGKVRDEMEHVDMVVEGDDWKERDDAVDQKEDEIYKEVESDGEEDAKDNKKENAEEKTKVEKIVEFSKFKPKIIIHEVPDGEDDHNQSNIEIDNKQNQEADDHENQLNDNVDKPKHPSTDCDPVELCITEGLTQDGYLEKVSFSISKDAKQLEPCVQITCTILDFCKISRPGILAHMIPPEELESEIHTFQKAISVPLKPEVKIEEYIASPPLELSSTIEITTREIVPEIEAPVTDAMPVDPLILEKHEDMQKIENDVIDDKFEIVDVIAISPEEDERVSLASITINPEVQEKINEISESIPVEPVEDKLVELPSFPVEPEEDERVQHPTQQIEPEFDEKVEFESKPIEPADDERVKDTTIPIEPADDERVKDTTIPIEPADDERVKDTTIPIEPADDERVKDTTIPIEPADDERVKDTTIPIEPADDYRPATIHHKTRPTTDDVIFDIMRIEPYSDQKKEPQFKSVPIDPIQYVRYPKDLAK